MMEPFRKNSKQLQIVIIFRKSAPPETFDCILDTPQALLPRTYVDPTRISIMKVFSNNS